MSNVKYGIGDVVVLNDGPLRHARKEVEFEIMAVLPDVNGQAQYRVRCGAEGFDRRIVASDIDTDRTGSAKIEATQAAEITLSREPWFKPLSIKATK